MESYHIQLVGGGLVRRVRSSAPWQWHVRDAHSRIKGLDLCAVP